MRRYHVLMVVIAATAVRSPAQATTSRAPGPSKQVQGIQFQQLVITPFAHIRFCLAYPKDCQAIGARNQRIRLDAVRQAELLEINTRVNQTIRPQRNNRGVVGDAWIVWPRACPLAITSLTFG